MGFGQHAEGGSQEWVTLFPARARVPFFLLPTVVLLVYLFPFRVMKN